MKTLAELKAIEKEFYEREQRERNSRYEKQKEQDAIWYRDKFPVVVQETANNVVLKLEERLRETKEIPREFVYSIDAGSHGDKTSAVVDAVCKVLREAGYNPWQSYRHGHDDGVPTEGYGPSDWAYYDITLK